MASTVPSFPVELDNGNGTTTRIASTSCTVYSVPAATDRTSVSTDANGVFPATGVSDAPGTTVRVRIPNYQGRAGYIETVTV